MCCLLVLNLVSSTLRHELEQTGAGDSCFSVLVRMEGYAAIQPSAGRRSQQRCHHVVTVPILVSIRILWVSFPSAATLIDVASSTMLCIQHCYLLPCHGCHSKQGNEKGSGTGRQHSQRMQLRANRRVKKTASGFNEFKQSQSSHESRFLMEKSRDDLKFE